MRSEIELLRAEPAEARPLGVDDEAKAILGYVVADAGPFKTGRGEFDEASLKAIVKLINSEPVGLAVNYGHHAERPGTPEALDAFLGRAKNARIDEDRVRADLYFDPVAFLSVSGMVSRGHYLMARVKSDPASLSTSLVLNAEKIDRFDNRSRRKLDDRGNPLPPLWRPTGLLSSDVVSRGDAVHRGILAAENSGELDLKRRRWEQKKRTAGK